MRKAATGEVVVFISVALLSFVSAAATVRDVAQFPLGTWLENIAVRWNGQILVTRLDVPEVWSVDPLTGHTARVATLTGVMGTSGITELAPDVFAVGASNVTLEKALPILHTSSLWLLRKTNLGLSWKIEKVVDVPEAGMINGLTTLDAHAGTVLAADPDFGTIYRIDTRTGAYDVVISDPLLTVDPESKFPLGVNGIRTLTLAGQRWLYFATTSRGSVGRFPIARDGTTTGPAQIIANKTDFNGVLLDDFALASDGTVYVTTHVFNRLMRVAPDGTITTVAGEQNSTAVAGGTSAALGRGLFDRNTVYVVTDGGMEKPVEGHPVEGGKVIAVTLHK